MPYIIFGLWGLGVYLLSLLEPTPISLMIGVGFIVFAPGFAIGRLVRLKLETGLDKTILAMTMGFIYAWILGFAGILLGLTIDALSLVWLAGLGILAGAAIILDIRKPQKTQAASALKIKDIFTTNNLVYLLVFATVFLIIMYLVRIGALFKGGDANYHLATLRKVIGTEPLTIHNLNYARDKMMIVYGFPVWHIFLGLVVKLTRSDMFAVWRDMSAALLGLSMLVWYWLSRKVLPTRDLAVLAFIAFAFFGFYWGPAYVYSSFGIPHTFSQLFLLPLAAGLILTYVFERPGWKLFALIILLILTATAVHITFYFYLLTILISLTVFYAALCWRDPEYKNILKRLATLVAAQLLIVLPLALGLELKGHAISNYFKIFQNPAYPTGIKYEGVNDFNGYSLYAYIFLPLTLIFLKRYSKLVLPLAALMAIPIIYFTPLRVILAKLIGLVYINRLYGSLDWSFLVWGLALGILLILVDRGLQKLLKLKANRLAIDIGLGLFAAFLFYWQEQTHWAKELWKTLFDGRFLAQVEQYYLWPLGVLGILGLAIFLWQIAKKKQSFGFEEIHFPLARFFLMSILVLIIAAPDWTVFKTYLFEKNGPEYFWRAMGAGAKAKAENYSAVLGGPEVVEFINTQIPSKSVFDTNVGYFYLPIMVDQHMPTYYSRAATEHIELYDEERTLTSRLAILHKYRIEYLLVKPFKDGTTVFDDQPLYFTRIYDGEYKIYQLNKEEVSRDYPKYDMRRPDEKFQDYIL